MSTETSNTIANADGSFTLDQYQSPINYQKADGSWAPIDTTLVDAPGDAYAAQNAAGDYTAKIPADPATTPVQFSHDGAWVTMKIHGAADTAPAIDGSTATLDDVAKTDGLTYQAVNTGLKEDITLDAPPTTAVSYVYDIATSTGLTPSIDSQGDVVFTAPDGTVPIQIPAAEMHDSATPIVESNAITYTLSANATDGPGGNTGWELTVTPDLGWLTDPARVYPVTVDPSLSNQNPPIDCYIQSAAPTTNHCGDDSTYIRVGGTDSTPPRTRPDPVQHRHRRQPAPGRGRGRLREGAALPAVLPDHPDHRRSLDRLLDVSGRAAVHQQRHLEQPRPLRTVLDRRQPHRLHQGRHRHHGRQRRGRLPRVHRHRRRPRMGRRHRRLQRPRPHAGRRGQHPARLRLRRRRQPHR